MAKAIIERERLVVELERGAAKQRLRLEDCAKAWLIGKLATIKPSTRRTYADALDLHILISCRTWRNKHQYWWYLRFEATPPGGMHRRRDGKIILISRLRPGQ